MRSARATGTNDKRTKRCRDRRSHEGANFCECRFALMWKSLIRHQQRYRIADAAQTRGADKGSQCGVFWRNANASLDRQPRCDQHAEGFSQHQSQNDPQENPHVIARVHTDRKADSGRGKSEQRQDHIGAPR